MQLKYLFMFFFGFGIVLAQEEKPIEVDFLLNYYDQSGENSAVTGGTGTEELNNIGTKIIINIPRNENESFNISLNADVYTSASSDNIDPVRSGASGQDLHAYGNFEYNVELPESNTAYSLAAGFSNEYDYNSFSVGGSFTFSSKDKNRHLSMSTMNFFDFVKLIYPVELRRSGKLLKDDQRRTYSLSLNYSHVVNKKLQLAVMSDFVYQKGLLSTPFNRIYFKDSGSVDVERLPDNRFKLPMGIRLNYFLSDEIITRMHYRYYYDTFGITSHTLNLETPIRISQTWAVIPFIRYHDQSEADYFAPFAEHSIDDTYYTSDYDLSGFSSYKAGAGIRYYPIDGIGKIFNYDLKRLDLRVGYYSRSDGLDAFNITLGFSLAIP